jgi:hypothetical protein
VEGQSRRAIEESRAARADQGWWGISLKTGLVRLRRKDCDALLRNRETEQEIPSTAVGLLERERLGVSIVRRVGETELATCELGPGEQRTTSENRLVEHEPELEQGGGDSGDKNLSDVISVTFVHIYNLINEECSSKNHSTHITNSCRFSSEPSSISPSHSRSLLVSRPLFRTYRRTTSRSFP